MQGTHAVNLQKTVRLYRFGDFCLDLSERTLFHGGERIHLGPMVFDTLAVLVESAGRIVSKDDLLSRLWPGTFVQESSLAQNVYLLRRALGGDHYIETVPKIGYRFTVPVESGAAEPTRLVPTVTLPSPPSAQVAPRRHNLRWVLGAITVLIFGLVLWRQRVNQAHLAIRSIAVLPFVSLGEPQNQTAIADGLTEQLIYELARTGRLRVVARTSSSQYKNQARDVREIGRSLNVDAILEGSVRRDQDTLRVTAQLNRVADGYLLWSRTFDRGLRDTLGLQEEIAQSLAETVLGAPVPGGSHTRLLPRNAVAREAYLDGRYQWNFETGLGMAKAVDLFKKSVALEPDFAPAHAMLADSYLMLAVYNIAEPSQMLPLARGAAMRALELDPVLPRALSVVGLEEVLAGEDRTSAEQHFLAAIRNSPSTPRYRFLYAYYLLGPAGRVDEAERHLAVAEDSDPFAATVAAGKIAAPLFARDYQRAVATGEKVMKKLPDCFLCSYTDSLALGAAGRYQDSLRMIGRTEELAGQEFSAGTRWKAYCLVKLGRVDEARKIANNMEQASLHRYQNAEQIAHIYASLGERRAALKWLQKGYEQRAFGMTFLDAFPAYDFLRGDKDYERIRLAMRLPGR